MNLLRMENSLWYEFLLKINAFVVEEKKVCNVFFVEVCSHVTNNRTDITYITVCRYSVCSSG